MKRLRKLADEQDKEFDVPPGLDSQEPSVEEAQQLVQTAYDTIDGVVNSYKVMYESLNELASKYPGLYDEIKLVVKFPNENDAEDIKQMQDSFMGLLDHYKDAEYLGGIIGVREEE